MGPEDAIGIVRSALWLVVKVSGPAMFVALVIGLLIAFLQAITQIQEMTLTFIPKILAVFLSLMIFGSYMLTSLTDFAMELADKIISLGA